MKLIFSNAVLIQLVLVAIINLHLHFASATIGVNYGIEMANIPSPLDVVKLCQKEKITQVRLLFNGSQELIDNLTSSGISVSFTMGNDEVEAMAETWYTAMQWFRTNVEPLFQVGRVNFDYIAIGNNMVSGPGSDRIVTAMSNMWEVLNQNGLAGKIKVTTIVNASVLGVSNPPSAGELNSEAKGTMIKIIDWLRSTNNPLMIDVHPYLALASDPSKVPLEYALFNTTEPVIIDGQYKYYSLFEATVDAFYAALEKNGWSSNATLVVSGTGWPSAGNAPYTSIQNAQTYNQKLIDKMKQSGTPRRPKDILDISISSLFNEDQKAAGVEQNWGINYPDSKPVYPLNF